MSWAAPLMEHGGFLLAGGSAFLALGLLINLLQRAPVQRMRIAELAVGCSLLFTAITFAPMPRPLAATATPKLGASTERTDLAPYLELIEQTRSSLQADAAPQESPALVESPAVTAPAALPTASALQPTHSVEPLASPAEPVGFATWTWPTMLLWTWLIGATLTALWLLGGALRVRRVLRRSHPAPQPVLRLLRDRGVVLPKRVRLRLSEQSVRPFCVGLLRPTIVIPRSLLDDHQVASLGPVVHHELAHATQRDARGLWLFAVAQVPFWFHPLYWWLRAQHRFATELIADAIAAGSSSNRAYARDLVHLVERQASESTPVVGATALFRKRSDFYQRMQMLLTRQQPLATRTSLRRRALHGFFGLALLTGASTLGGTAPLLAQEPVNDPQALIAELRAENTQLRAELSEMRVVLSEMRQLLEDMRAEQSIHRQAAEHAHDGYLQNLVADGSHQQLLALGYLAVEDYTVREGDTVNKLFDRLDIHTKEGMQQLQDMNPDVPMIDPIRGGFRTHALKPGQQLRIPVAKGVDFAPQSNESIEYTATSYVVQKGDSVFKIARRFNLNTRELHLLFYRLNQDRFGSADPSAMHSQPLRVGEILKVPVANGDGEVVATGGGEEQVPILADVPLIGELFDSAKEPSSTSVSAATFVEPDLAECMEIAFRLIDLEGEMEGLHGQLEHSQRLAEQGLVSEKELRRDAIALQTMERKIRLARRVVEAKIMGYEQQIAELTSRYKETHPAFPRRQIEACTHAIELLRETL